MMATGNFHIPNLIEVGKQNTVTLGRTVFFDEFSQIAYAFPCRVYKWENDVVDCIFCNSVFYQRVICKYLSVSVDAFGRAQGYVFFVDSRFAVNALVFLIIRISLRNGGVAVCFCREGNFHACVFRFINAVCFVYRLF